MAKANIKRDSSSNNEKNNADDYVKIAIGAFVIALLILVVIWIADITDFPSNIGIVNESNSHDWRNMVIEYFGAVSSAFIGFIAAIMAVGITLNRQEKIRIEDNAKNALPLVKISSILDFSSIKTEIMLNAQDVNKDQRILEMRFKISNAGQREMYDIWIGDYVSESFKLSKRGYISPILYKDDNPLYTSVRLYQPIGPDADEDIFLAKFKVFFKDCYGNWYYQQIKCNCYSEDSEYRAESYSVASAPIPSSETQLPKKNAK